MDNKKIISLIKSSFCELTSFKVRNNSLEVITAFSTLNGKFISVFITFTDGKFIITDNGWIDQNYYEYPNYDDSEDLINRIIHSFKSFYSVKSTLDKTDIEYYYKSCNSLDELTSNVFDLANFSVGVVNAFCIQFKDEKEEIERETFRKDANNFLKANYSESVQLRRSLDDIKNIKFNAIINIKSRLHLITYITGSTPYYFDNDLRKSIVNFELTERSKYLKQIQERISIINDGAEGYNPLKASSLLQLLNEKTTKEPILWTNKEQILDLI